jgi:hypothetical protein
MRFKEGNTGRPKGTKNKVDRTSKEFIAMLTDGNRNEFERRWKNLPDKAFCDLYLELMSYIVCKPKEQENAVNELDLTNAFKQAINATY